MICRFPLGEADLWGGDDPAQLDSARLGRSGKEGKIGVSGYLSKASPMDLGRGSSKRKTGPRAADASASGAVTFQLSKS